MQKLNTFEAFYLVMQGFPFLMMAWSGLLDGVENVRARVLDAG